MNDQTSLTNVGAGKDFIASTFRGSGFMPLSLIKNPR